MRGSKADELEIWEYHKITGKAATAGRGRRKIAEKLIKFQGLYFVSKQNIDYSAKGWLTGRDFGWETTVKSSLSIFGRLVPRSFLGYPNPQMLKSLAKNGVIFTYN